MLVRPGYTHVVHELLVNIKRAAVNGRQAKDTESNLLATCDHIDSLAEQALGYFEEDGSA